MHLVDRDHGQRWGMMKMPRIGRADMELIVLLAIVLALAIVVIVLLWFTG
jgi:hypothetical protein